MMPRPSADYNTRSKGARAKLDPRPKPYYRHIAPNRTLGYIRRGGGAGIWVVREWEAGAYKRRSLGAADDVAPADGRDVLTFDQALQIANKPRSAQRVGNMTVSAALTAYFDTIDSKHAAAYKAVADKHIVPALGGHRIDRLTKTQIERWQTGLLRDDPDDPDVRRRSQDTANRILTHLKAALNLAFQDDANDIPTDSAWRRVKPYRDVSRARQEHFDAAQVRLLVAKAATFDRQFADLIEVSYLTGARLGELSSADVRDFDPVKGTLRVDGKTGPRIVTLTNEAVVKLRRVTAERAPTAPLLPRTDGGRWRNTQNRPMQKALKLAGLPAAASLYSLRHSYISRAIEAGMPLSLVSENCGTSLTMIERNYAHVLAQTRRDTIEKTAPKLRRVK
ncbi:MAG: tyrosine-type recombinase/integrase [Burkholderiales bacterium]|nr:tyrosine-type recombinase/integrase [Burkholderiales bacterium]